jgi:hypothetical protein
MSVTRVIYICILVKFQFILASVKLAVITNIMDNLYDIKILHRNKTDPQCFSKVILYFIRTLGHHQGATRLDKLDTLASRSSTGINTACGIHDHMVSTAQHKTQIDYTKVIQIPIT